MDMQDACAAMLEDIEGALGCIVIDMQTGLAVAAEYRAGSVVDATAINLVSVISTDMFRGKMIRQFESVLARRSSGLPGFVREVQMTTAATNQFMAVIPGWNDGVFVLVTDKSVSLGLGWMTVHRMVGRIGAAEAAWAGPNQEHRNPALERQPFTGPDSGPSHVAPAVPLPARYAGHQNAPAGYAASPEPYGGAPSVVVARGYNEVTPGGPGPAGGGRAMAAGRDTANDAGANQQPAPQAAPADQQQPDAPAPQVALGPRMNVMRKPRVARK